MSATITLHADLFYADSEWPSICPSRASRTYLGHVAPLLLNSITEADDRVRRSEAIHNALSSCTGPFEPCDSPEYGPGDSQFATPSSTPNPELDDISMAPPPTTNPAFNSTTVLLSQATANLVSHEAKSRREKRKAHSRGHRKEVHDLKITAKGPVNRKTRSNTSKKHAGFGKVVKVANFRVANLSIAPGGDIGRHRPAEKTLPSLASLMARPGFQYIPNDGLSSLGVVDPDGTLVAGIFPGPTSRDPNTPLWGSVIDEMSGLMERLRSEEDISFLKGETHHRRGDYTVVSSGITHGNGRKAPGNLRERHPTIVQELKDNGAVRRIIGHQDGVSI
ncbi:uncharacterized protein STEHIDRAFT_164108 [Stereum hirsutum FP-91666 SS1]|uniref:Uncharacterized protein n=1 Tax=Stereum hirsutum (strain FP-91666) TaxID=721885 RepID=R7RW66_STEHR|nr:uncharacterized protein STEHIDRAFT_164108 [Stereum hirsutum FP-91666 SS1]EIM79003.1 hypothetical protein STEHIDRAFT_164108 [Stereum hirsutum FP-91666 SS1]